MCNVLFEARNRTRSFNYIRQWIPNNNNSISWKVLIALRDNSRFGIILTVLSYVVSIAVLKLWLKNDYNNISKVYSNIGGNWTTLERTICGIRARSREANFGSNRWPTIDDISFMCCSVFCSLLFVLVDSYKTSNEYQFGIKSNHSTATCTRVFKKFVNHYRQRVSHVFACFIDSKKAFANVDYWQLFRNLIDNDPSIKRLAATRLPTYWYSNQQMFIQWQNNTKESFKIHNGIRKLRWPIITIISRVYYLLEYS